MNSCSSSSLLLLWVTLHIDILLLLEVQLLAPDRGRAHDVVPTLSSFVTHDALVSRTESGNGPDPSGDIDCPQGGSRVSVFLLVVLALH